MAKIAVYYFEKLDHDARERVRSTLMATGETISKLRGEKIQGTAIFVDSSKINVNGFYFPENDYAAECKRIPANASGN